MVLDIWFLDNEALKDGNNGAIEALEDAGIFKGFNSPIIAIFKRFIIQKSDIQNHWN